MAPIPEQQNDAVSVSPSGEGHHDQEPQNEFCYLRNLIRGKEIIMQIEVQYEDRSLKLPGPPVLHSLYEILGPNYTYRPSGKSDKELLGDALQEKYSK